MLYERGESFAEYYCRLIRENGIRHIHFKRSDVKLYDEGLVGSELLEAQENGQARRDRIMTFFRTTAEEHLAGRLPLHEVYEVLDAQRSSETRPIPRLLRICLIGDGTLFEGGDFWFIVRASGTDAVMRYYIEGVDLTTVQNIEETLLGLNIQ
jgi:phosphomannomutase